MRKIHVFNPAAGKDKCVPNNIKDEVYQTTCTKIRIENVKKLCSDGEISHVNNADISIAKNALRYI